MGVKWFEMIKCIKHRIKNLFSFSEEAGRLDFFFTNIFLIVIFVVGFLLSNFLVDIPSFIEKYSKGCFSDPFKCFGSHVEPSYIAYSIRGIFNLLVTFFIATALFANLSRRLNDLWINRWALLILLVPILNILFELYVLFVPGKKKNK